jgi:glycosyltransferase involved in cell wall biosynthesis
MRAALKINEPFMMQVYLYVRHFPPTGDRLRDGIVKAVHGLASGLVAAGAAVTVLSENSATEDSSVLTAAGYRIECFSNPIQTRPAFRLSPRLEPYIRNLPPHSLVILNGIFHASIYSLSRLCRQHHVPYVIAPHDVYSPAMFSKNPQLKWTYWWLLEKRMLRQARALQVLDIRQGDWLQRLGISTPILEVPNGIAIESELNEKSRYLSIPKLLFFGRIDIYHKGLDLLLEAFREVVVEIEAELVIQGPDEGDRLRLEQQAMMIPHVTFLDPEYERSPVSLMGDYDMFCLPSRFEGFGLAALEAMVAGQVLLVSAEAGIAPHVVASGCGVVVQPNVAAIKEGLLALLRRRQEWQEMGMQGRRYALERLDWRQIGVEALGQYVRLVVG